MKNVILALIFFSFPCLLVAQEQEEAPENPEGIETLFGYIYGNLQFGIPIEEFRDNLENTGVGGGGLAVFKLGDSPLWLGAEASGMAYDSESQILTANIGGFFRDYELRTSSNIFLAHAVLRIQANWNRGVQPYVDGMIGLKSLFTRTKLIDLFLEEDNVLENNKDQGDVAFSYGIAAGLRLHLFNNSGIAINLRCAYLPGTSASYLVRRSDIGDLVIEDPIDAFEEKTSPTSLLVPQIGISFALTSYQE